MKYCCWSFLVHLLVSWQHSSGLPWCTSDREPFFLVCRFSLCWSATSWRERRTLSPGPGTRWLDLLCQHSYSWDQNHGALACILLTLTQWSTKVAIQYLPPYLPSQEEKDDPQLYADNVRQVAQSFWSFELIFLLQLMAKQLEVPLCPLSFKEAKLKFGRKKIQ